MTRLFLLLISFTTFFIFISCSDDTKETPQIVTESELSGLLGEEITIIGENFEQNKLQVFFDLEQAYLTYFSPTEIRLRVPRSLKRYNPVLKVVNLETNENILNTTFTLKTPQINNYGASEITFDEKLIINGENFDVDKSFVEVFINNEKAQILNVNHNTIEILIPYKIFDANLEVKINAQLQSVISTTPLKIKTPIIEANLTDIIDQYGTRLKVTGLNFNPENQYGEVYLNGVLSDYGSTNSLLDIYVPIGPFTEFKITNITYKTAGLTVSFDVNIDITRPGIMVDGFPDIYGLDIIVYNNKAYSFTAKLNQGHGYKIELYEFSPETEKWSRIENFGFDGHLHDVIFDNNNSIYLYKNIASDTFELTKLNLDDFIETKIPVPFHESLNGSAIFSFQNNLYVLYGSTYENDQTIYSNKKFIHKSNDNKWEEIISNSFSESLWKSGRIDNRFFYKESLYFSIGGASGYSYELTSDFDLNDGLGSNMLFNYKEKIIGRQPNIVNGRAYLYDMFNINNATNVQFGHSNFGWFFVLGNNIYYHAQDGGLFYTFRLRNDFLNEILY